MFLAAYLFSIPYTKSLLKSKKLQASLVIISSLLCIIYDGKVVYENLLYRIWAIPNLQNFPALSPNNFAKRVGLFVAIPRSQAYKISVKLFQRLLRDFHCNPYCEKRDTKNSRLFCHSEGISTKYVKSKFRFLLNDKFCGNFKTPISSANYATTLC